MDDKTFYEKYYPGPYQNVPGIEEGEQKQKGPTGLLPDHNTTPGFSATPFETEGEGSSGPAARA